MVNGFVLGIARETMRMSLIRFTPETETDYITWKHRLFEMSIVASIYGAVFGLMSTPLLSLMMIVKDVKQFKFASKMYSYSAVVELLAEPLIIYFMHSNLINVRLTGETVFAITRCFLLYYYAVKGVGLDEFVHLLGSSQLWLTVGTLVFYLATFVSHEMITVPLKNRLSLWRLYKLTTSQSGDKKDENMIVPVFKQSVSRYLMAQADGLVMSWLSPLPIIEQGIFSLASNYINLFPRVIQAPLEENGFMLFSRTIDKGDGEEQRKAYQYFNSVVKFDLLVGLCLVMLGAQFTGFMSIYLSTSDIATAKQLSRLLQAGFVLLPVMSISGISESFMNSTVGPLGMARIRNFNSILCLFNVINCYILAKLFGAVGLAMATIVNFSIRAFIAFVYVFGRPNKHKTIDCLISMQLVKRISLVSASTYCVGMYYGFGSSNHILAGAISGLVAIHSVLKYEPSVLKLFVN
jgi:hypothetical protein